MNEVRDIPFEEFEPVRKFPAYKGKRAHEGSFWFASSGRHVRFESYFEMIALTLLDFTHQIEKVSSNPFWLLWPKGSKPARHAPDFFARLADGSVLVVDVHPRKYLTERIQTQHSRTRAVCNSVGWTYHEFTEIHDAVQHNIALVAAYSHRRFAPEPMVRETILSRALPPEIGGAPLASILAAVGHECGLDHISALTAFHHLAWQRDVHFDLAVPLTIDSTVWR
ncbi:TnsA-like heteromeric transposase endonuclease subunit [Gordonia sp. VNQ95]|uniref:TnsA-like heteromeric transposase endonuclease subunit n=1 Tax=Gordonia sp. VNQ95 TaxID=3156619 RepID=UPI0032B599EE